MNQLELECTLLQIDDMKYIKKKNENFEYFRLNLAYMRKF